MRNYIFAAIFALGLPGHAQVCTVNWTNVYQRIDGFGASSAWQSTWTSTEANLFFSTNNGIVYTDKLSTTTTNNGIGLSLLRNHITYASSTSSNAIPTTVETSIMLMAQTNGAEVWSTPWTPAAGFKSVNDIYDSGVATAGGLDGGSYLGSGNNITNLNYASQLANYVYSMSNSYHVNIYAISIQNEPDADVTSYEACQWSRPADSRLRHQPLRRVGCQGLWFNEDNNSGEPELDGSKGFCLHCHERQCLQRGWHHCLPQL